MTTGSFDFPSTHTPPNHPSCIGYEDFLDNFLVEEVELGHMSGPFSRLEVDSIFGDTTFVTTPFILDIKTAVIGDPKKVRVCRNSSKIYADGLSVNSFINPDDFSTAWTTAADVAEIVSIFFPAPHSLYWSFALPLAPLLLLLIAVIAGFLCLQSLHDLSYPPHSHCAPPLLAVIARPFLVSAVIAAILTLLFSVILSITTLFTCPLMTYSSLLMVSSCS